MAAKKAIKSDLTSRKVAYFSMEVGIDSNIPTYSGGLGVLAGDTLRSFADIRVPAIGITLLYRKGFFNQKIVDGCQVEEAVKWDPKDHMTLLKEVVEVEIAGRPVKVQAWLYQAQGVNSTVPIIFLDTNVKENDAFARSLTEKLYGYNERYRLGQEMILGVGGVKMLHKLGVKPQKYHMNEGHSALLTLELSKKYKTINEVRKHCVFTTHTPVPAGHDKFERELAEEMLGDLIIDKCKDKIWHDNCLNMTYLGLVFSAHINGVAKKHTEVSKGMFPGYTIESITNGIHSKFWTSKPFQALYDKYIPNWDQDPFSLRNAISIPTEKIWAAHFKNKEKLIATVNKKWNTGMDVDDFTIGYARRFTAYKRPDLALYDVEWLKAIAQRVGEINIIFAGKAHPNDGFGKDIIRKINQIAYAVNTSDCKVKIAFMENYNIDLAKKIISGVDVWLNNPQRPHEASGTSGMKAAVNGVPQFSVLDGWWLEGHIEDTTGWSIGLHPHDKGFDSDASPKDEAGDFYNKLEHVILPKFYSNMDEWTRIMRNCMAFNGSFFNTQRMAYQYVMNSYFI